MKAVNYVICAAGLGKRFSNLLPGIPKPLIKIFNKTSLELSLESLPIFFGDKIIIITQKSHGVKAALEALVQEKYRFNQVVWFEIDGITGGQLETAYMARDVFDLSLGVAIFNCDTYFQSRDFIRLIQDEEIEGIVPCSKEEGHEWSFCKVDSNNNVTDIKEKERISDLASVGLYYFRDAEKFIEMARQELQDPAISGEYYVANLYRKYLQQKSKIMVAEVDLFKPMGTPKQIEEYWGIKSSEIKLHNQEKKVLVIDLDNTITIEEKSVAYGEKQPNLAVIAKIREYKEKGYEIIINSARRMKTHKNEEAKVIAEIAQTTIIWLGKYNVPFDGIKFGKPFAENGFYVDDRAIRPNEFLTLSEEEILRIIGLKE